MSNYELNIRDANIEAHLDLEKERKVTQAQDMNEPEQPEKANDHAIYI